MIFHVFIFIQAKHIVLIQRHTSNRPGVPFLFKNVCVKLCSLWKKMEQFTDGNLTVSHKPVSTVNSQFIKLKQRKSQRWSKFDLMILLIRLLLSFNFYWENTSNNRDIVSSAIQINNSNLVKNTLQRVVFSTLFSVFEYSDEALSLGFVIWHDTGKLAKCKLVAHSIYSMLATSYTKM